MALVKAKTQLWDFTSDIYKLAELKPLAWKQIADVLEWDTKFVLISISRYHRF